MKDIIGYEGLYAITSCGKVWSYRSQRFLRPSLDKNGYCRVNLTKQNKSQTFYIHRLVAEAYIPNPDGLPQINHKDEDKTHNYINNLEWVSCKDNLNHGTRNIRSATRRGLPVYCVELDRVFESQAQAARELGLAQSNISKCCKNSSRTIGGYHWKYYN